MSDENTATPSPKRPRRGIVTTVLVTATLVGIVAGFSVWSARQLLETDQWTETSSQLLENEEIREAVGTLAVDALFANVDIQGQLEGALPPRLAPLAGPAVGGLRSLAENNAPKLLERPRVQALWEQLNRAAHERLVAVINDDAPAVSKSGGEVYLDLGVIVGALGTDLGIGAASKIPAGVAQVDVMSADDLEVVQDGAKLLEDLAYVSTALFLLLLALAVYLARGWRREAIRSCGFVFVIVGVLILVARSIAGGFVVDALTATAAGEPAAEAVWSIATSLLGDLGVALIGYGVAIVLGAWIASKGALATSARRSITPFIRDRRTLNPILFAIVIAVYVWSPTEGTRRLIPSLILIALLVAGAEALRRQAREEFPDATMDAWSQRWADRIESIRERGRTNLAAHRAKGSAPVVAAPSDRISQLERLSELHKSGVLDDEEFAQEKELIRG